MSCFFYLVQVFVFVWFLTFFDFDCWPFAYSIETSEQNLLVSMRLCF